MDDWLKLEQDPNTQQHILSGWIDHEYFGVRGFCHGHDNCSQLKEYLDKESTLNYDDNSSSHEQGKRTEYLVTCAINVLPGLSIRTGRWNSQADHFLKWDLVMHWENQDIFFPMQIKSSLTGINEALQNCCDDGWSKKVEPIREQLKRDANIALAIRKLYYDSPRKLPDKPDKYENPIALRFKKKQAYFEEMSASTKFSIPIFIWANNQEYQVSIQGIIKIFQETFAISSKNIEEHTSKAISLFEEKFKTPKVTAGTRKKRKFTPMSKEVKEREKDRVPNLVITSLPQVPSEDPSPEIITARDLMS
jgi:hypothetical protein